jgi:hypothetical protein
VPVTPDPAVAGPFTGGQKVTQEPVHFEVVGVSGANEYKVNPPALVSTCFPPIVVAISVDPDALAAGLDAPAAAGVLLVPAAGVVPEELDELPHAATASTAAARPTAVIIFRIEKHLLTPVLISHPGSRARRVIRSPG